MNTLPNQTNYKEHFVSNDIDKNIIELRTIMGNTADLNVMEIIISNVQCAVITIEGMVATSFMSELVFRPLMQLKVAGDDPSKEIFNFCTKQSLLSSERRIVNSYGEIMQLLFSGFAIVLIDKIPNTVALGIQGYDKRAISPPSSERNIMGSHDGFTEVVRTNISLIRRRIKNPSLRFEMMQIGEKTATDVCIVYMQDIAPAKLVDRVRKKLKNIKLDTIMASGYIKPFIEEKVSQNLFSSVSDTERPDVFCIKIAEGKIGVLVDGTPFALVCPSLFLENFRTIDDYCSKTYFAAYLRWIRYIAFFLAVAFPGMCVAVTNFHPEMITLKLLLNLSASEQTTPHSTFFEVLVVMALLELMREASIRLPSAVGNAVSIVGALVIGDAAVKSGIISSPMLIIVGITATAAFTVPSLNQQSSILRLVYIFAGGSAGFLGISICTIMIIANICAMDEFHVPFTSPVAPFSMKDFSDILARKSFRKMEKDHISINDLIDKR